MSEAALASAAAVRAANEAEAAEARADERVELTERARAALEAEVAVLTRQRAEATTAAEAASEAALEAAATEARATERMQQAEHTAADLEAENAVLRRSTATQVALQLQAIELTLLPWSIALVCSIFACGWVLASRAARKAATAASHQLLPSQEAEHEPEPTSQLRVAPRGMWGAYDEWRGAHAVATAESMIAPSDGGSDCAPVDGGYDYAPVAGSSTAACALSSARSTASSASPSSAVYSCAHAAERVMNFSAQASSVGVPIAPLPLHPVGEETVWEWSADGWRSSAGSR